MAPRDTIPTVTVDLPDHVFGALRKRLLLEAKRNGARVVEDGAGVLTLSTALGRLGIHDTPHGVNVWIAAEDPRRLFLMEHAVLARMTAGDADIAGALRWAAGAVPDDLPQNLTVARVTAVEDLGPVFVRLTLSGQDLSAYGDAAIHFRLVQPSDATPPEWPTTGANGAARWPEGPGAPHRPV
ncbi:MAG: hypothetical protein AAF281_04340, partial [Pseudomonadota bacterium]